MNIDSVPIDATAAQIQYVCGLTEAMAAALSEARTMANQSDLGPQFAELLLHVGELQELMNETLAEFDPEQAQPLLLLPAQMRSTTNALLSKVAN